MFKYMRLADYLRKLMTTNSQLKDLIYDPNSKVDPRVAYSNLSLILNNLPKFQQTHRQLSKITKRNNKQDGVQINNKYLLFVVIAEYINVGKIVGGGKVKKLVMENLAMLPQIEVESKINRQVVNVRLRQCCTNKQQLTKWQQTLSRYPTQQHPSIPNLFSIPQQQYSSLSAQHPTMRSSSACVIQSFSSNLPAYLLFESLPSTLNDPSNEGIRFDIIDACAAPGNKTIQLAEYLGERGRVFAFDRDQRRFEMLNRNAHRYEASNVQPICADFLTSQPNQFSKVRLIMLDPSCSGSGMLINFSRQISNNSNQHQHQQVQQVPFAQFADQSYKNLSPQHKQSVQELKQLQLSLLRHATTFDPLRISYSTCSIYREQNEAVVKQFLREFPQYYVKPMWNCIYGKNGRIIKNGDKNSVYNKNDDNKEGNQDSNEGLLVRGFGKSMRNCIRVDPRARKSDGFFVCIFARRKQISPHDYLD